MVSTIEEGNDAPFWRQRFDTSPSWSEPGALCLQIPLTSLDGIGSVNTQWHFLGAKVDQDWLIPTWMWTPSPPSSD